MNSIQWLQVETLDEKKERFPFFCKTGKNGFSLKRWFPCTLARDFQQSFPFFSCFSDSTNELVVPNALAVNLTVGDLSFDPPPAAFYHCVGDLSFDPPPAFLHWMARVPLWPDSSGGVSPPLGSAMAWRTIHPHEGLAPTFIIAATSDNQS